MPIHPVLISVACSHAVSRSTGAAFLRPTAAAATAAPVPKDRSLHERLASKVYHAPPTQQLPGQMGP